MNLGKKLMVFVTGLSLLLVSACNEGGTDVKKIPLKTDDDKTFYTMGFMLGSNLARLNLNDKEMQALYKGIVASASGQESEVEMEKFQPRIQTMFKERMEKVAKAEKENGKKYLEDYLKKNKNAKKTESGLVYEILKEGTGAAPKETDEVEVHYHGTLTNGEVFDSSVDRKKTVTFPLNRVIKGWTEGVQLLKEGGKIRLVIPAELGYGEQGAPPKIPGGATLVFEVELFKVNPKKEEPKADAKKGAKKDDHADHGH